MTFMPVTVTLIKQIPNQANFTISKVENGVFIRLGPNMLPLTCSLHIF